MSNSRAGRLRREEARTLDWRTRIHPDDLDRIVAESIAGEATLRAVHARGAVPAARANIAGCERVAAALRPRRGADRASSASRPTSPSPRKPSSSFGGRSRSAPPNWPRAKPSSARSSRRCWRSWSCSKPDGTVLEVNQPARDLAPLEPRRGDRQEVVGRADAQALSAACRGHEARASRRPRRARSSRPK